VLASAFLSACAPKVEPPRNVIVILVDALRSDRLGVYGHAGGTSPNIDRLAGSAYVYENAYSTSTWTVPAVASLFTGTLPVVHRIDRPPNDQYAFSVLHDAYLLASEVFRANGFVTGMITTIGWVSEMAGYGQGVDELIWTDRSDASLVSRAREFITKHREDRFHLYLHLIDLHDYYDPERIFSVVDLDRLDDDSALFEVKGMSREDSYYHLNRVLGPEGRLTSSDIDWLLEVYDRELSRTDEQIGLLIDHLRNEGLLEKTIIVVTADHGEQFMEHGALFHGNDAFYNNVLRVPLIIAVPGLLREPKPVRAPVSLIDVYPTLFDLLGIPPADPYQGAIVLEDADREREVYATDGNVWKVITLDHSYITGSPGREELYDLGDDPGEESNLVHREGMAPVRADLRRRLQDMRDACAKHPYLQTLAEPGTTAMSEEERKALESLGYIGNDQE